MTKLKENSIGGYTIRSFTWLLLFGGFVFGLAFIVTSQIGLSTLDTFATPFRLLTGVSDTTLYGKAFLMPIGITMILIAIAIHYKMNKKVRLDYVLALIPIIVLGFTFDFILKIPFFAQQMNFNIAATPSPLSENPMSILYALIGFVLYVFTLGAMSAMKIAPNSYVMLVSEIALLKKKEYKTIQWIIDGVFVIVGFIFLTIAISIGQSDNAHQLQWWKLLKIFGPLTILLVLTQGYLINLSFKGSEKLVKYTFV